MMAIIGPNGSGKSNLADAIRWVLGERSTKELRATQSLDVLFAGTAQQRAASRAWVELTFDNEDGRWPLETAEVSLRRELTRSGESAYLLNGEGIRLIELQQLLGEVGIGAKSYAVISQGTVDRYVVATAEERRELFEEACGIKSLQIKVRSSQNMLTRTHQHAREISAMVHELTPQVRVLSRQATRYQERGAIQQAYDRALDAFLASQWHDSQQAQATLTNQRLGLLDTLAAARQRREEAESQLLAEGRESVPVQVIEQELRGATEAYRRELAEYEKVQTARQEIDEALEKLTLEEEQANVALSRARQASVHFDALKGLRATLRACGDLLLAWENRQALSLETVANLRQDIDRILSLTADELPLTAAHDIVKQLEQPLQEVARVRTLREEKARQREHLPTASPPTRDQLEALAKKLEAAGGTSGRRVPEANDLAAAREAELACERELGAATAALEQAGAQAASVEQDILRERGQKWLERLTAGQVEIAGDASETKVQALAHKLAAIGSIDPVIIKEYEEAKLRHENLTRQLADITQTEEDLTAAIARLTQTIAERFATNLATISRSFSEYFTHLFGGGEAHLKESEAGIEIIVQPPGKRPRYLSLLSGGEKSLTALALVLAILEGQQPPFIVLDEVDAALDEANSARFSNIVRQKASQTQVITITHNRETMGQADTLYGVTMQRDGISKVYSVKLSDVTESGEVESKAEVKV